MGARDPLSARHANSECLHLLKYAGPKRFQLQGASRTFHETWICGGPLNRAQANKSSPKKQCPSNLFILAFHRARAYGQAIFLANFRESFESQIDNLQGINYSDSPKHNPVHVKHIRPHLSSTPFVQHRCNLKAKH